MAKKKKPKKKPAGRHTKYSPIVLKQTKEYVAGCIDEEAEFHKTRGVASDSYERTIRVNLPTLEGLAVHLKVHRDTIHAWSRTHKLFSDELEHLKAEQARRLIAGGLSGTYNTVIAKLLLASTHGMRERTDITSNDKPLADVTSLKHLSDEELIAIANARSGKGDTGE